MTLNARTPLTEVAVAVGDALRRHGIRGVLTGGACACLHSHGEYVSRDVDDVLPTDTPLAELDAAMAGIRFRRDGNRYLHPRCRFFVEFPAGPLAIGQDSSPRPVLIRRGAHRTLSLSATDACRDRLAAFYHWGDRQALKVAVQIACANRVGIQRIRSWSADEGATAGFEEFLAAVKAAHRS
ncbi:MAG: hypothetical protein ABL977_08695 [Candidatus Eisenbacteria bacterium]